jgi:CRP-like cAMP-binding protein
MNFPETSILELDEEASARILRGSSFRALTSSSRAALLAIAKVERLPKRTRLTDQGQPMETFAILGEGRVRVERRTGTRNFPLGHRGPGDIVGEMAVSGALATESSVVTDDGEALLVQVPPFRALVASDAAVRDALMATLVELQQSTEARLTGLLVQDVTARLAAFLLAARRRWAVPHEQGELISATFTHVDLAQMIGSTRETVTLLLGKLKREGVLAIDRRRIVIRSLSALRRCADDSPANV